MLDMLFGQWQTENKALATQIESMTQHYHMLHRRVDFNERMLILITTTLDQPSLNDAEILKEVKDLMSIYDKSDVKSLYAHGRSLLERMGYVQNDNGKYVRPASSAKEDEPVEKRQKTTQ